MREGTLNTTQSTLLRRKCPEAHLTPSQDLAMWTAFDLVYVPLGDQCSQFWESLGSDTLFGYPDPLGRRRQRQGLTGFFFYFYFLL